MAKVANPRVVISPKDFNPCRNKIVAVGVDNIVV
jgi:hypothetical protein